MFCDQVTIRLIAGKGGDGSCTFRREKFIPYGGPDGGNGGNGGDIILKAENNITTLADFNTHKLFRAETGKRGGTKNKYGANGESLILPVPCGTLVYDERKQFLLTDLKHHGQEFLAVKGGRGGKGNAHFVSSVRQAPNFAELGEPGEEKLFFLELRLLADVGIVGFPSVGKSTLIAHISDARPKIADYPFTTLIPNLGVVYMRRFSAKLKESFVVADIPGLIEGASDGKGLGYDFLRHVSRTAVLLQLVDAASDDPISDFKIIRQELKKFDPSLSEKDFIVAFNKIDLIFEREKLSKFEKMFKKEGIKKLYFISAATGEGIKDLLFALLKIVLKNLEAGSEEAKKEVAEFKIFRPHLGGLSKQYEIDALGIEKRESVSHQLFRIRCPRLEQIVSMTDFKNQEALNRIYDVMNKLSITRELMRRGAAAGDILKIFDKEIEFLG